jgi:hypothetical protein
MKGYFKKILECCPPWMKKKRKISKFMDAGDNNWKEIEEN